MSDFNHVDSDIIADSCDEVANTIESDDGVASACIYQAANRIREQAKTIYALTMLKNLYKHALNDAIRKPKGVIPKSADGLEIDFPEYKK